MNKIYNIFAACSASRFDPATNSRWFQTFPPYGRYPVRGTIAKAAKDAEYIIDEAAAKAVIEHFREAAKKENWPGILVDREHFSLATDKPSDAMAWAKDIRQEADGSIWTRWDFTEPGEKLWTDKVLVNRSPAFCCEKVGKDYRPIELKSIGMTNTPHFSELSTLAAAKAGSTVQKISLEHLIAKARTDANGLSHGDDGRFDGGNGSSSSSSSGKSDDIKINDWDDPKTRKMKERLLKMREKNAAIRSELAQRRSALDQKKASVASLQNDVRKANVEKWKASVKK